MFEHEGTGGFLLGMQGVETDSAPVKFQASEEFARHRDFVGFLIDHGAAQIMLAWDSDGGEHLVAAGVARFFAIENDEFLLRWRTTHLGLKIEHGAFDGERIDFGVESAEGGLAWSGIASALAVFADTQGAALRLA